MINEIIATVHPWSHLPAGVIVRGKDEKKELKIEFKTNEPPTVVKEKLVEAKSDGTVVFRKEKETTKTSSERIKDEATPIKVKGKKK